ncbi:MAG: aryl-sulfate sulfotransferase [Nannocystaceae bacterium]|nr:aryl-sulfate sulfotransferase [Nannocystaceae bacterium]
MRHAWVMATAVLFGAGCGDDVPSGSETDGGSSSTQTASTGPDPATTSAPASSSSDADDDTTLGTTTEADTSSSGGELSALEAEVTLYPEQPMVVDITLVGDAALPADLQLVHDLDDGVRIAVLESPDALTRTFRVRGLAPVTKHGLTATAGDLSVSVSFTSEEPLPGFIGSFDVSGESSGERPYRMFDLIPFPTFDTSSLFVVDPAGQTRFHYGRPSGALPGPDSILAAAKLREDGTILSVLDNAVIVLDEFGHEVLRLDDEDIGIVGLHHDVLELDNGNFVSLSYSFETVDYPGVGPTLTAGDMVVEFTPSGELVWQWNSFDDLDPLYITEPVTDGPVILHPETGEAAYDWTHANGVVLSPDGASVMVSVRHQDWLVSIDRSSGEMQWRLGPGGDFSLSDGAWFYHPHSPQWQADGTLLLYDNGVGRPDVPETARVVRYAVNLNGMTATELWEDDDQSFSSPFAGDCDILPRSGNILVTDSAIFTKRAVTPRIRELDPELDSMTVWELGVPAGHFAYRTTANERLVGEPLR